MEPIRTTKTARLGYLKMYRDDLDQFVALFQRSCSNVTISDNQNRYESLDEMKAHLGPRIRGLDIRGEKPAVHFLLNRKEQSQPGSTAIVFNELRTEEITDEADAVFFKVQEFLVARQLPRVRIPFMIVALAALVTVMVIGIRNGSTVEVKNLWIVLVCIAAVTVPTIAAVAVNNMLSLETRLNSPSFWKRNWEAFLTHAITAAIGACVGGIIGWAIGHYMKK